MIVGDKYRPERVDGAYDAVVVGSGMGGLAAAALLARAGRRVLVLERHYTAGGFTQTYTRRGFEWDVGVHYVGEVGRPESPLRCLFAAVTGERIEWARMDEVYDQIHIADRVYDLHIGRERFRDALLAHFPRERRALDKYLKLVGQVQSAAPLMFLSKGFPAILAAATWPARARARSRYFAAKTADVLASVTDDVELRAVLAGQWGDYGLPPGQSSFGTHAMVASHYMEDGGFFPVGGASAIAAAAEQVIADAGGRILVRAEVERILIEGGRAVGVRLADGRQVRTGTVISAAGLATTLRKLLPPENDKTFAAARTLDAAGMSMAHLCVYLGIDGEGSSLGLRSRNYWLYPGPDHDANVARAIADETAPDPLTFISFPSAKDPSWRDRFPGKSTVEIIGFTTYDRFREWRDQPWRRRGNAYASYKQQLTEPLLDTLFRHYPQLQDRVAHCETSTPLSTEHFSNHSEGAIYGLAHTPARFAQDRVRPRTEIPGLYLTGQDVTMAGVAGALMSGAVTASAVMGWHGLAAERDWFT